MAKQIKKFGPAVLLITMIGVVVIVPLAQSDPPTGQGNPEIAQAVRGAVGFGPVDVLPALAQDNKHRQMINHARSFVADHEAELAPLVADYNSARDILAHAITWGENIEEARQAEQAARSAIVQAVADMLPA